MDCGQAEPLLSRRLDGELDPSLQAEVDAHLASCAACRSRWDAWRAQHDLLRDALAGLEPSRAPGARSSSSTRSSGGGAPPAFRSHPMPREETRILPAPRAWRWRRIAGWSAAAVVLLSVGLWLEAMRRWHAIDVAANPTDLQVLAPGTLLVGGRNEIQCTVLDRNTGTGMPGVQLAAYLKRDSDPEERVGGGDTDADGEARLVLDADAVRSGAQRLRIAVVSPPRATGNEVTLGVRAEHARRVLLTTDKPMYQPEQVVHVRALLMDTAGGRPAAGQVAVFEAEDAKGNKVFRKQVTTSAFGIAAVDVPLADELNQGAWKVRVRSDETESEKTITVARYVLPKFRLEVATDKAFYLPGERLVGSVDAQYFFGKPVAGAQVVVDLATFVERFDSFGRLEGKTDAAGHFDFAVDVPPTLHGLPLEGGNALLKIEAAVVDTADHTEKKTITRIGAREAIQVRVVHESGVPIPDVNNIYYVSASYPDGRPAATQVRVEGQSGGASLSCRTGANGVGTFTFVPRGKGSSYYVPPASVRVTATDAAGQQGSDVLDLERPVTVENQNQWQEDPKRRQRGADGRARFLLRADKAFYRVGESLHVSLVAAEPGGRYTIDLVRGGQTVLTRLVKAEGNETEVTIDLDGSVCGVLQVQAYRLLPDGNWARDRRLVYVDQPRGLEIAATLDKETYKPGETAVIEYRVTGEGNRPEQAALSLAAVDEAVFALSENQPGLEKVYFALEQAILEPRYQVKCAPVSLTALAQAPEPPPPDRQIAATVAFAALELPSLPEPVSTFAQHQVEWQEERWERRRHYEDFVSAILAGIGLGILALMAFLVLVVPGFHFRQMGYGSMAVFWWVVAPGSLGIAFLVAVKRTLGYRHSELLLVLVIIGLVFGALATAILRVARRPSGLAWAGLLATCVLVAAPVFLSATLGASKGGRMFTTATTSLDAGAPTSGEVSMGLESKGLREPGARSGSKGPADASLGQDARKASVRVREYFPETLFWRPQVITDEQGRARVEIPLADSITTWRLSTAAISALGKLGGMDRGVRVFQDFFVDLDLPVSLTDGDEIHLPVAVYNYLKEEQRVRLELEPADWYENLDAPKQEVTLAAGEVRAVTFGIRARRFGIGKLTVFAFGSKGFDDAVRRSIRVLPNGEPQETSVGNRLAAQATESLTVPREAIDGASQMYFKLYPGTFSQVVDGLDRMVRLPYG